ncbi:MAG: twin-arginine translocase subunit TatC, partial [Actinomycetota bacterium]|nr:twin-arginine translocase subunit TatC [Actinomycetota bacterium]
MPIGPKRLPLLEHLDELRKRLAVIAAVVFVGSMALYFYADWIYDLIMAPIIEVLGGENLNVFGPFEGFGLRFKVSLYATLIVGSPIILWQIMAFFLPALKPKEQHYV